MKPSPYIPGSHPANPGPLFRFLPAIETGTISGWLSAQSLTENWLLDPFGFSPSLVLEAAHSGYRVLVTANNPITRFLLELFAAPPSPADFVAALAELGALKKGDERLELHLRSLYLTTCAACQQRIEAHSFLWRKDEEVPYARIYTCPHCGDAGERPAMDEDRDLALQIAATDTLHRTRLFERVVSLSDEDRIYAEEAIAHYAPRPLYILATLLNRLNSLHLSQVRHRALLALLLLACDAGNTLWAYPAARPRPKQLITPHQFREDNLWAVLEQGLARFSEPASVVPMEPFGQGMKHLPESGGICIYEGRLKDLAQEIKREIPITAVFGAIPRPNQAFWTLSALWAGWLWGHDAVEPYKAALRRRRYDWAWNATALRSMFGHLNELLPDGVPVFGILPEPEPPFLTSALTAAQASGFELESVALRTEHDTAQLLWQSAQKKKTTILEVPAIRRNIHEFLQTRGEPAGYLHIHVAGLISLAKARALIQETDEIDYALRRTHNAMEQALRNTHEFRHYSANESIETGLWGLPAIKGIFQESLSDKVEMAAVNFLQKERRVTLAEIEAELNTRFTGLMTPSKGLVYAVLNSYAHYQDHHWLLRAEDLAQARREEMKSIIDQLKRLGQRLGYTVMQKDQIVTWHEEGQVIERFHIMASALIHRALEQDDEKTVLVIPGGRAPLVAYKLERDPALKEKINLRRLVKYRLLRTLLELPVLNRYTFAEQLASDPVEKAAGQMMMF